MVMDAFYVVGLVFAGSFLAWAATFGVRSLYRDFGTPFKQPDGTSDPAPPDRDQSSPPLRTVPSGPRRRVVLSAPDLSTALPPGWRLP